MKDCERLVKLLWETGMIETETRCEIVAEELLRNGVVVLPCQVGDDLYYFTSPESGVRKRTYPIGVVALTNDGWYVCDNWEEDDALYHCDKINTNDSYLSEEEAEKAYQEFRKKVFQERGD